MVWSWIRDEVNTDQQPQATIHKSGSAVRDLIGHAPDLVRFIQLYLFDSLHLRQKKRFSHQALDLWPFLHAPRLGSPVHARDPRIGI